MPAEERSGHWSDSTSRSFYNSPEYATFIESQGNTMTFLAMDDGTTRFPVLRPNVWTYWKRTPIPIPPMIAPPHSIYLGVLLPEPPKRSSFDSLLKQLGRKKWTTPFPRYDFVQPVLLESGPADFLDEFIESVNHAGLANSTTKSRILHLDVASSAAPAIDTYSHEMLTAVPEFTSLIDNYAKKRKYDIRRAPKEGVTVGVSRITSDEMAAEVYSSIMLIHTESWLRTGLGPHSLSYWVGMSRAVRDSGGHDFVSRAYSRDGRIISVAVVHLLGKSAFYHMNSSTIEGQQVSANPYGLHAAITAANLWGAEYFELGRHSDDEGAKASSVTAYKTEFGGELLRVPNFSLSTPFGR